MRRPRPGCGRHRRIRQSQRRQALARRAERRLAAPAPVRASARTTETPAARGRLHTASLKALAQFESGFNVFLFTVHWQQLFLHHQRQLILEMRRARAGWRCRIQAGTAPADRARTRRHRRSSRRSPRSTCLPRSRTPRERDRAEQPRAAGPPLPGRSALPLAKRKTSPHFTSSAPYRCTALVGGRGQRGGRRGRIGQAVTLSRAAVRGRTSREACRPCRRFRRRSTGRRTSGTARRHGCRRPCDDPTSRAPAPASVPPAAFRRSGRILSASSIRVECFFAISCS